LNQSDDQSDVLPATATAEASLPSVDRCADAAPADGMDAHITNIQPGGGVVMSIELLWGRLRRSYLRAFRPGYVRRMQAKRRGQRGSLPFEPVDPRDVKYFRNQPVYWWDEADDPFRWRNRLGFVRVGLAELVLIGGAFLLLAVAAAFVWWPLAVGPLVLCGLVVWFFRNPRRQIPDHPGTIVSPADGKLVQIDRIDDPELGPCVQFGIFLSIFNVHANRASLPGRVAGIRYRPGKFLNALRTESARENESLDLVLEETEAPGGRIRIRQITGQFARRIVCWAKLGEVFDRGEMFGMIKLGSRTELVVPDHPMLEITAELGDRLAAGSSVLGHYQGLGKPQQDYEYESVPPRANV
jgi:phosphatidylserine decarboxylase